MNRLTVNNGSIMDYTTWQDHTNDFFCTTCFPDIVPRPLAFATRKDYLEYGVPLYEASRNGDWKAAKVILDQHPEFVRFSLSDNYTALHVVALSKETDATIHFVKNLVHMMNPEDLELRNVYSNTALHLAAPAGNMTMVMIMVNKNRALLNIRGSDRRWPLTHCAKMGKPILVNYFYHESQKMTGDHWTDTDRDAVLFNCVMSGLFDVALQLLHDHPELDRNVSILGLLARKHEAFNRVEKHLVNIIIETFFRFVHIEVPVAAEEDTDALKLLKLIWGYASRNLSMDEIYKLLLDPPIDHVDDGREQYNSILFVAAKKGNVRLIAELCRTFPELLTKLNKDGHTVFHIAVKRRHQGIYNMLYEIGSMKHNVCKDPDIMGNSMLHLVGKSSKKATAKKSGASLLMQRELLWFLEVEDMMPPHMKEGKNNDNKTAYELFSEENKELVSNGLKWMQDCMVVATLIITIAFAVAFTVPGGYKQDKEEEGFPIFIHETAFLVFVISDAISLFSSTTSLLVFLSILTSRHNERDFMRSLPSKVMTGLLTLFISVAALMATFSASFFVLYRNGFKWVPILIAILAGVPVILFAALQSPLLVDMFRSTYDAHYIFKTKK